MYRLTQAHKHSRCDPCNCRLRKKLATYEDLQGAPGSLGVPPGSADLTLKIKDVDPRHIPEGLADSDSDPSAEPNEDRKKPHLKIKVGGT